MTKAVRVLVCDGIGEYGPLTMAGGLARLTGLPYQHVEYSRSYGPVGGGNGQPYVDTREQGMAAGKKLLDDGTPTVLIGFSAGAHIAGDLVWTRHNAIVGAVLIADPMQPTDVTLNGLSGIAGQPVDGRLRHRHFLGPRPLTPIRWVSRPRDVIPQCPADSPLRDFADFTELLSLRPADLRPYVMDMVGDMRERIARPRTLLQLLGAGRRYSRAADDALGYLAPPIGRGEHVLYGDNFAELAQWIRGVDA